VLLRWDMMGRITEGPSHYYSNDLAPSSLLVTPLELGFRVGGVGSLGLPDLERIGGCRTDGGVRRDGGEVGRQEREAQQD
jgi:hypothetical protein